MSQELSTAKLNVALKTNIASNLNEVQGSFLFRMIAQHTCIDFNNNPFADIVLIVSFLLFSAISIILGKENGLSFFLSSWSVLGFFGILYPFLPYRKYEKEKRAFVKELNSSIRKYKIAVNAFLEIYELALETGTFEENIEVFRNVACRFEEIFPQLKKPEKIMTQYLRTDP